VTFSGNANDQTLFQRGMAVIDVDSLANATGI